MGAAERLADDIACLATPEFADACRTEDRFLAGDRLSHLRPADRARLQGRSLGARAALVDVGGEAPERPVTSVPASAAELAETYRARWGVETCLRTLKGKLRPGSWSGASRHQILQDPCAAACLANVVEDMCQGRRRRRSEQVLRLPRPQARPRARGEQAPGLPLGLPRRGGGDVPSHGPDKAGEVLPPLGDPARRQAPLLVHPQAVLLTL